MDSNTQVQTQKPLKCEWGVVKRIWLSESEVILIHSPEFWETASRIEQGLRENGINVVRLNTGVDEDARRAEELLDMCFQ